MTRVDRCAYFAAGTCRSCARIEEPYEDQLARKERDVRARLAPVAGGSPAAVPLVASARSRELGFRNRMKLSVTGTHAEPVLGLLGEDDLDAGRELLACPIHHPWLNELVARVRAWIPTVAALEPYRIRERRGELKGLIAYYAPGGGGTPGEGYLRLVVRSSASVEALRAAVTRLQASVPGHACVTANVQPIPHAILEGPDEEWLTERREITLALDELRLRLSPRAFAQTQVELATELYAEAARWVAEAGSRRMAELYCGQGPFSFFAARAVPGLEALGIEVNAEAVATATATARELGLEGLRFVARDATAVEAEVAAYAPDLVLVNPPRKGLGEGAAMLARLAPPEVLYSSCDVATLARDLEVLCAGGAYRVRRARVFDLFAHTDHFETLVWLSRR